LFLLLLSPFLGRRRQGESRVHKADVHMELYPAKSLLASAMAVPPAELLGWMPVGPGQLLNPWMLYSISTR